MKRTIADLVKWAKRNSACGGAVTWLKSLPQDKPASYAWRICERGDWMIWWLRKSGARISHKRWALMACAFARSALKYVSAGEGRPRLAIEAAEKWAAHPTEENRQAAAAAAAAAAADAAHAARKAHADIIRKIVKRMPWGQA